MSNAITVFIAVLISTTLYGATPDFTVEPGLTVEVGEAVYLNGSITTDTSPIYNGRFEWDFDDGTVMKYGSPNSYNMDAGIAAIHYFMAPGIYTVTMDYTSAGGGTSSATKNITVTGEAPVDGFELWHAPFHARISQYIYAQIPTAYRSNGTQLRITITGDNSHSAILFDESNLDAEEIALLINEDLPAGNYVLQGELLDASDSRISVWRDKFPKPYNGAPKVGINKDNALVRDGELFFPVTPWMLNHAHFGTWGHRWINTAYVTGWYNSHDQTTWNDYLTKCDNSNLAALGPGGPGHTWDHDVTTQTRRNASMTKLADFVNHNKDEDAILAWMWEDEPNLGGRDEKVPSPVLSAWTHVTHKNDPLHPVSTQMYGFDWLPYSIGDSPDYTGWYYTDTYDYLYNARMYGGKKHFPCDISGQDIYPLAFREHARMQDDDRGPIELWVTAMDQQMERNYRLIPFMQFLETTQLYEHYPAGPTAAQLKMESWLSVIHGAKGINWFHLFTTTPTENFTAMETFLTQVTALKDVILGPVADIAVTDNANTRRNRVDITARVLDNELYIFACRLSDADDPEDEITVTFTNPATYLNTDAVTVYDESRTLDLSNGRTTFTDTFTNGEVHIYHAPIPPKVGINDFTNFTQSTRTVQSITCRKCDFSTKPLLTTLNGATISLDAAPVNTMYILHDADSGDAYKVLIVE